MRLRKIVCLVISLSCICFLPLSNAFAAEGQAASVAVRPLLQAEPQESGEEDMPVVVEVSGRYMPEVKAKNQSGEVEVIDSSSEISYKTKAFGKMPVEFALEQQYIGLHNTTLVDLPAHLNGLSLSMDATVPFFGIKNTYLRVGISPSFFGDDWDLDASSFRIPTRVIGIHQYNDQLIFIAGVGIFPHYNDVVVPILGLIYKPNDRLTFSLTPDDPHVSYSVNDRLTLLAEGGLTYGEYEVDTQSLENQILKYQEARLGAGFRYRLNKHISGKFSAGGVFDRKITYDPDSLGKVSIHNGAYCEFRITAEM